MLKLKNCFWESNMSTCGERDLENLEEHFDLEGKKININSFFKLFLLVYFGGMKFLIKFERMHNQIN